VSVADVGAALRAVIDGIEREPQRAARVAAALQSSRDRLAATVRASRHPLAMRALGAVAAAVDRVREADDLAAQAEEAARGYARAMGVAIAESGQPPTDIGQTRGPTATPAQAARSPLSRWVDDAGGRLPRRLGGKGPTHGLLFDGGGTPFTGTPLTQSGGFLRSGAAPGARDGLRPDWHPLAQVTREHVEAHAAELLRKPGAPNDAVLVVTKPTCVSRGEYVGCDEVLPEVADWRSTRPMERPPDR
jgi:hypothetical protein